MPRILIKELDSTEKGPGSDMNLYFHGCIVKVSTDGVKDPVWMKYHGPHTSEGGHAFEQVDKKVIYVPLMHPKAYIEWFFPTGWFNTKKSSLFCERIPKRQYLKGLHTQANFRVASAEKLCHDLGFMSSKDESLGKALQQVLHEGKTVFNLGLVDSTFNKPVYPPFEDAYILLKSKKVFSRALTPDLSVVPHPSTKDFVVLCHDVPVAELLTKNKLKVFLPEFKPECLAYFQKEGVSVIS